jgi:hypothetical protein
VQPRDLLKTARLLLSSSRGKPSAVNLRRATSAAYYALFHCLARNCADLLIGGTGANRSEPAWQQVYRSLEHGYVKDRCKNNQMMARFPPGIQDFATTFLSLQEKRHSADYDPFARFAKSTVAADINQAEEAIALFMASLVSDRRADASKNRWLFAG